MQLKAHKQRRHVSPMTTSNGEKIAMQSILGIFNPSFCVANQTSQTFASKLLISQKNLFLEQKGSFAKVRKQTLKNSPMF